MLHGDLKLLADQWLDDAKALYHKARYNGAAYMCGYTLEFALKARICKVLCLQKYPEGNDYKSFHVHNLEILLHLSGLENQLKADPNLFAEWSLVLGWDPRQRYVVKECTKAEVGMTLARVIDILKWLKKSW